MNYFIENGITTDGKFYYPINGLRKTWHHPITQACLTNIPNGLISLVLNTKMSPEELTCIYVQMRKICGMNNLLVNHNSCTTLIATAALIRAFMDPQFELDEDGGDVWLN